MPGVGVMQILREEDSEGIAQPSILAGANSNPMAVIAIYVRAVKSLGLVSDMPRIEHTNKTRVIFAAHCA